MFSIRYSSADFVEGERRLSWVSILKQEKNKGQIKKIAGRNNRAGLQTRLALRPVLREPANGRAFSVTSGDAFIKPGF
jgi:hypothetical protein